MQRLKDDSIKQLPGDELANILETATVAVRQAYSECPDYEKLIPALLEHGTDNLLEHVHFEPGIPVKAMLARPTNGVSEVLDKFADSEFTCEYKYDGERAQVCTFNPGARLFFQQFFPFRHQAGERLVIDRLLSICCACFVTRLWRRYMCCMMAQSTFIAATWRARLPSTQMLLRA